MGEASKRKELGMEPRTVRLPALTHDEMHTLHHLMHRRLDELQAAGEDDAAQKELAALAALHRKLFNH